MKIVIADYADSMMPAHTKEVAFLRARLPEAEVITYVYQDERRAEFYDVLEDATALLTGFIKIDGELLAHAPHLRVISINATGYDNIDLEQAKLHEVGICVVGEYCTEDVAEFTLATMLSLVKNLRFYENDVEKHEQWRFDYPPINKRLREMTLGIFGFGKIGSAVAKKARGLGMSVLAYDPYTVKEEKAKRIGVSICSDPKEVLERADIITNHMNLNQTNYHFFDKNKFAGMKLQPYFINMSRGACVMEADLIQALDDNLLRGAALDVLTSEQPQLAHQPLLGRENVLVTPHAAFYSQTSLEALQKISCQNIVHYLLGERDQIFKLVM